MTSGSSVKWGQWAFGGTYYVIYKCLSYLSLILAIITKALTVANRNLTACQAYPKYLFNPLNEHIWQVPFDPHGPKRLLYPSLRSAGSRSQRKAYFKPGAMLDTLHWRVL